MSSDPQARTQVALAGVPETMLWTLHNRASEALRADGVLRDDQAVRLYHAIDYDYVRHFGKADGSHAIRSRLFDDALRPWLAAQPGGTVVELGAGLETQLWRVDDGRVQWLCVDVPDAIALRERLLPAHPRCRNLAMSALDLRWLDAAASGSAVFISAQGLFMYFDRAEVQRLVTEIVERLPGVTLMFDAIPPWFSRKTVRGWHKTPHYRVPPMPWGIGRADIAPTLRRWNPRITRVEQIPFGYLRGVQGWLLPLMTRLPGLRNLLPSVVRLEAASRNTAM